MPSKAPQIPALVTQGQEAIVRMVEDQGSHYKDPSTNSIYTKYGTPKRLRISASQALSLSRHGSLVLLSGERAASYEPPAGSFEVKLLHPDSANTDNPLYTNVRVTQSTFDSLGIELAAKALRDAQRPPTWLMVICILGGVGVGWIIKMLVDIAIAKASGG